MQIKKIKSFIFMKYLSCNFATEQCSSALTQWLLTQKRWKVKMQKWIKRGIEKDPSAPLLLQKTDMNLFNLSFNFCAMIRHGARAGGTGGAVQLPSQSAPTILVLKNGVGLRTWKKPGPKYGVQKAGCKKQGQCYSKKKRSGCLFSFWITMTLLFAPCFLQPIFLDLFF